MMNKKETQFVHLVLEFYAENGRHTLPWRNTRDPYKILVSEVMLQQTQVDRVVPKYCAFIDRFPTVYVLAQARLSDVLVLWQGLGYNRRAKMLHECAKKVTSAHAGVFPDTYEALITLPGIGPYTSSAVLAFAFGTPTALIETNVRSVFLHHFFKEKTQVSDAELLPYIERTVDKDDPRTWYYALMDYGTYLKKTYGNPNKRSSHHTVQSQFKGSDRQIRGAIIRLLTQKKHTRAELLSKLSSFEDIRVDAQIAKLLSEQMVVQKGKQYLLP